jgi:23S rRNA (cytosine1962-C5)-methyltransferase
LPETLQIPFNDKLWNVDLLNGQKTGMFLDQRENYQAAQIYARGQVLDAFSYAGGFGIHCATGAANVECVDIAEPALALVRRNLEVNRLENVTTVLDNCFDLLRCYQDSGRRFDMIVLDPPAFAKSRAAVGQAKKGYKEINLRALKILNPGGHLVTCSCSYHISSLQFAQLLRQAAADAHREVQVVEIRGQGRDHPVLLSMPETQYLKCWILRAF